MSDSERTLMSSPWTYFLATIAWTWSLCGVLIFWDLRDAPVVSGLILILAMIGPGVTGIVFTQLTRDAAGRRDFRKRIIDTSRITKVWLGIVILLPLALQLMAGVLDRITGGVGPTWGDAVPDFLANPGGQLLTLWVISLVPFFEELGWRGYAQDRLQETFSPLTASAILGGVWSLWHVPAFFTPGTYHAALGPWSLEFWLFCIGVVALSIVVSWIYLNTGRSILIMVVFHASVNLAGEMIRLSAVGETFFTAAWFVAALAIALVFGTSMRVRTLAMPSLQWRRVAVLSVGVIGLSYATVQAQPMRSDASPAELRFEAELAAVREEFGFPGATATYRLANGSLHEFAVGHADVELALPMTPQSRMLAASIGKTFVGAILVDLAGEGTVDLDAPLSTWLGERAWFTRLPNRDTMTLRHALTHTAGVADHVQQVEFQEALSERWSRAAEPMSPEELIAFVLDLPPLSEAGAQWHYSDTGYVLAGLVIEVVTGRDFYAVVRERFLDPLGLTHTSASDRCELPGLAAGYLAADNPFGLPPKTTQQPGVMLWDPAVEWTGGGFVSTSSDLVRWGHALFAGTALGADARDQLLRTVPTDQDGAHTRYGIAVVVHESDGPLGTSYGHSGWIPGYCSRLAYFPTHDVTLAFQINTDVDLIDNPRPVLFEIEQRLATIAVRESNEATEAQQP